MTLFQKNVNSELLVAIEYTKILFASNYAVESVLYDLEKKKFGSVTKAARNVVGTIKSGKTAQEALLAEKGKNHNKNMQAYLSALSSESSADISRRLTDIGKHIVAEKKLYVETFMDNLKSKIGWLVTLMALPLLVYFVIELSSGAFTELFGGISPGLIQTIYIAITAAGALVIFGVLASLRYKE